MNPTDLADVSGYTYSHIDLQSLGLREGSVLTARVGTDVPLTERNARARR